jgi:hypothetical protein
LQYRECQIGWPGWSTFGPPAGASPKYDLDLGPIGPESVKAIDHFIISVWASGSC